MEQMDPAVSNAVVSRRSRKGNQSVESPRISLSLLVTNRQMDRSCRWTMERIDSRSLLNGTEMLHQRQQEAQRRFLPLTSICEDFSPKEY